MIAPMGQFVIAVYRPKPGKEEALVDLVRQHVPVLRQEGLATERPAFAMRAADGSVVELFEWASAAAADDSHRNPAVQEMRRRFEEVCDSIPLRDLPESQELFPPFGPIELT